MPNRDALHAGPIRMVIVSCLGLGPLGLVWGCMVDPGIPPPAAYYGATGSVHGADAPYYDESFWGAWGGGGYGGFYGRGFGGTRLYHGGAHGGTRALRAGGFHGAAGGRHGG